MRPPAGQARLGSLDDSQFRALAETSPDAIVTAAATGDIAYVNAAAERLFGHRAEAMVGRPISMLMPSELRPLHDAGFERYVRTGVPRLVGSTVEVEAMDATGRRFPAELSLGTAGEGAERTLTAVLRDLTERQRRERHLTAQLAVTEVLAGPLQAHETAARAVDALARALGWDVGVLWLLGDDGELAVHHVWEADPAATGAFAEATRRRRLRAGEGLPGEALTLGVPVWHDAIVTVPGFLRAPEAQAAGLRAAICLPLITEGRATGVIECFTREPSPLDDELRDLLLTVAGQVGERLERLQARERLEEARRTFAAELERSNAELEHFASVAAHDLQTPLRTISGFAELLALRHGDRLDDEAQGWLELVTRNAQGCARLLDNLLDFARAGATVLDRGPVDTEEVVGDVLGALRAEVDRRGAEVRVGPLPAVIADRVQLAQLLQNLVANAIKFVAPDRRPVVEVRGVRDGATVTLSVADNGIGIAPEEAERLFGMFSRGTGGVGVEGAGIGLAVCAKIAERHGGRIWVEPAPGGGSVFCVALDAAP